MNSKQELHSPAMLRSEVLANEHERKAVIKSLSGHAPLLKNALCADIRSYSIGFDGKGTSDIILASEVMNQFPEMDIYKKAFAYELEIVKQASIKASNHRFQGCDVDDTLLTEAIDGLVLGHLRDRSLFKDSYNHKHFIFDQVRKGLDGPSLEQYGHPIKISMYRLSSRKDFGYAFTEISKDVRKGIYTSAKKEFF